MKKNASILGFIGLLVLIVFVSGCTSSNNNTSNQTSNIIVQINSNSSWNGTLTYNTKVYNINGTNNKNYNLGTNPGFVSVYLKNNNDTSNLTVQLLQGTNIIENKSTSANNDVVSISHDFL